MGDRALYVGGGLFGGVETGVVEGDLREPYSVVGEYIENVTEVVGGYPARILWCDSLSLQLPQPTPRSEHLNFRPGHPQTISDSA